MKLFVLAAAAGLLAAQPRVEGRALKAKGDAAGALAVLERAAVLEPNAADLRDEIGFLLAVQGRQSEAISHFEHAIRLNPRYAPAHYHLGVARWLLKDAGPAILAMREAAKIDSLNLEYRFRLITMLSETGDDSSALGEAKTGGNRADLWNLIGILQQRKGDLKAARDAYRQAVQLKPAGNEYRNNLGLMLVDLGRNDVGRVSEPGSVSVSELMVVERYSHVMHIVSNVRGRLSPGKDSYDVIRACFPAGTVSGAPKIRAMQIIDELEPTKRGPYAGAVGYFGFSGNMDTCITIRTLVIKDGTAYIQAGGGVVADSDPASEYQETVNKAKAMMRAVEMAEKGLD